MMRGLGILLWAGLLMCAGSASADVPKPVVKIENPGQCIAPAAEMRKNHMEMLKHRRDQTMREGIRGGANAASLNACIECHAGKSSGTVLGGKASGTDGFCESCHTYVAVKLDCWDCHQPKAGYKPVARTAPPGGFKP